MALTETKALSLGFKAPDFTLVDSKDNQSKSLQELKGTKATVFCFMCNHCPYVKHVIDQIISVANDYKPHGVNWIAINSNNIDKYPEDSPEKMKEWAEEKSFPFPYLFDADQQVAKAYDAACTPDFAIFDADLKCVYRGRLDGSTPGNSVANDGADLRNALNRILENKKIESQQVPSMGCNIKWK